MLARAKVINGNLIYERISDFYQQLSSQFEGQEVEIEIKKKKKTRSKNQNNFYWGALLPSLRQALIDAGYFMQNDDQVHELLKLKFLKATIVKEDTGEVIETLGSTKEMDTMEFEIFLTNVRAWAAEYLNVALPIPNE